MKDKETRIEFKVIDSNTGKEADIGKIALKEDWAKGLCYCDMEGFAILDDGNLVLLDECGRFEYCPSERFSIKFEDNVILSREEYEGLKGCENTVKRLSKISPTEAESENKALKEEVAIVLAQKRNIWNSYNQLKQNMESEISKRVKEELDRVEREASKKAAEKILLPLYDACKEDIYGQVVVDFAILENFAKQFGLEIKE